MRPVAAAVVLGLLAGAWAQVPPTNFPPVSRPFCDSADVEEAAFVGQDYINAQHTYGYKYILNRIEDVKVTQLSGGEELYSMELDLLETKCHVLDPTPLANCTVRPKHEVAIEADCDVLVKKMAGVLSPLAFKCKSKPDSREEFCVGCMELLPLNDTDALQVVHSSLALYNNKSTDNSTFELLEVGRMSSQIVSLGAKIMVEYVILETTCNASGSCIPLNFTLARRGFCTGSGTPVELYVDCDIVEAGAAPMDTSRKAATSHPSSGGPGHKHHRLIRLHDPSASGLLSESQESAEVPIVKRQVPPDVEAIVMPEIPLAPGIQLCPGKIRHFST
ncbi:hypothetical protein MATL_G00030980 [Megalops atlanticus]|uniref:Cystatin fetuin-A-type domain-containing protein n=1 Tax=Megalops atlanticus TaxID=7932 RepID=A0A9D3TIB7_MEGAT|nr:hypothetical protein MATL_G00030980 [Megalops atlanticus]